MSNPLSQYFRQPAIYIQLPSNGEFYPDGTLIMPENNELPVLPMTAIDEITYRTPDALFNGSAVVNVIQSCVPNIKNAWAVPSTDVDTILVGIRIASYGHDMEVNTVCPKCNHEEMLNLDLRTAIDQMTRPDYKTPAHYGDLEIYFRPMTYKTLNQNNQLQFEEQKLLQSLAQNENATPEAQSQQLSDILRKITNMTVSAIAQSIGAIKTPDALVSDVQSIAEFLQNCDRKVFNSIRDKVIELKNKAELKPLHINCPECSHEYEQPFTLDMTSFFGPAS